MTSLKTRYGEWALVTGASSGLGKALAFRLAEAGVNVCLLARNQEALEMVAQLVQQRWGVETRLIVADLADAASIEQVEKQTQDLNIGLFVAAAGFGTSGEFVDSALNDELMMLQVNCAAVLELTHVFTNRFIKQQRGGIILFGSLVGFQGAPFASHYAATKAYVQTLAEGLYHELKPYGVDVLCAAPGPVSTGFGVRANMVMDGAMQPEPLSKEIIAALGKKSTVKPGFLSKFLLFSLGLLPRWGRVRVMRRVMGNMTKHQRS